MRSEGQILHVLVADDDPSMRLVLTMAFQRRGHVVRVAEDTDAARALIDQGGLDVALIDAGMPRNGTTLWSDCRANGDPPGGALLLTGDVYALGDLADHPDVLAKPFDFGELVARVERMGGVRQRSDDDGSAA